MSELNEVITQDEREVEACARLAHEINRAYCRALGDYSQPSWDEAPDWQKESARDGVRFHLYHSSSMEPSESHANWMAKKLEDGWTYGPVKDPEKKEHPCMVPFDELPVEQRAKDFLFAASVIEASRILLSS